MCVESFIGAVVDVGRFSIARTLELIRGQRRDYEWLIQGFEHHILEVTMDLVHGQHLF